MTENTTPAAAGTRPDGLDMTEVHRQLAGLYDAVARATHFERVVAAITDTHNDGADCPRAGSLIAHLEGHRPLRLYFGDEECLLAECDHRRAERGCVEMRPGKAICVTCSAVHDPGSEWGPEWLSSCRVEWPCQPIRAVAEHYDIPLPGQEVTVSWAP